ncbi:MAG TPA: hypothetical protein VMT62_10170 [Syntrophorhabdaceae bacterium]|nr:hypothetical protein [Syntrophorhabdaceae bacterium]
MRKSWMLKLYALVIVSVLSGCMPLPQPGDGTYGSSGGRLAQKKGAPQAALKRSGSSPGASLSRSGMADASATTGSGTPVITVTQPLAGVYSLQALIAFDDLDGAIYDPATGTVSLFGHRESNNYSTAVPYLDYLATALESKSPIFSLEWTAASERQVDRALTISDSELVDKLGDIFDQNGRLTPIGEWWLKQGGAQVRAGMTRYDANSKVFEATGRTKEARALQLIGARDEALNRGEQGREEFEELARVLGIYDQLADYAGRYRAGQISQVELMDYAMPLYVGGIAEVFGQNPDTYIQRYRLLRSRGVGFDAALEQAVSEIVTRENQKAWLRNAYDDLFRNKSEVYVPPAIMKQILNVEPRVRPVFTGLPPQSLLAHTAFEADVFCKSLPNIPELKNKVPQYRTYFEWRRTKTRAPATDGHTWISPGVIDIVESQDGNAMRFSNFKMKFNLEKYVNGKSVSDPLLSEYALELSARYDEISREYPVLRQMREAMKVVAVAEWINKKGARLHFPEQGRGSWNPPADYPGVIHMAIAIQSGPVGAIITAAGGVDMRVEDWWNLRKGDYLDVPVVKSMTVPSLKEPDSELNKVYKTLKIVEPPSPARDLPGWVAQAKSGQQALQYVSVKQSELNQKTDSAEILLQLQKVKKKAELLDYYDRLINAQTKERMLAVQEMTRLKEESDKKKQELLDEAQGLAFSVLVNLRKLDWAAAPATAERRNAEKFLETVEDLSRIKELANGFLEELERIKKGEADPDRLIKVGKELADDAIEVRKVLTPEGQDWVREGDIFDPKNVRMAHAPEWTRAEDVATKSSVVAGVAFGAASIEMKSFEYLDMYRANAEIADSLGEHAKDLGEIERMRARLIQEYTVEKRKLERMMSP